MAIRTIDLDFGEAIKREIYTFQSVDKGDWNYLQLKEGVGCKILP